MTTPAYGSRYTDEVRAATIKDYFDHPRHSIRRVAERHGVSESVVRIWLRQSGLQPHVSVPRAEELAALVYRVVLATLESIEARAIATADIDWIQNQNAADLAALDTAQRDFVLRCLAGFRPEPEPESGEHVYALVGAPENGAPDAGERAVDPAG